ncbi:MAG: DUF6056 family protein [Myxococcota bacterium]
MSARKVDPASVHPASSDAAPQADALPSTGRRAFAVALAMLLLAGAAIQLAYVVDAFPAHDDWCRTYRGRTSDVLTVVGEEYRTWTGRWLGIGLAVSTGAVFPDIVRGYPWALGLGALLLFLSAMGLLRSLLPSARRIQLTAAAGLVILFLLTRAPQVGEMLFWLTGACEYLVPLAVSWMLMAALHRATATDGRHGWAWALAACAAAALAPLHELAGLMGLGFVAVLALASFLNGKQPPRALWLVAAVGVAGLVTNVLAPGNSVRLGVAPAEPSVVKVLAYSFLKLHHMVLDWVADPAVWTGTFWLALVAARTAPPSRYRMRPLAWLVSVVAVAWGAYAACAWALDYWVPPRVIGLITGWLVGAWLHGVVWFASSHAELVQRVTDRAPRVAAAVPWLMLVMIYGHGNMRSLGYDAITRLPRYSSVMRANLAALAASPPDTVVTVRVPPESPRALTTLLTPDSAQAYFDAACLRESLGGSEPRLEGKDDVPATGASPPGHGR